jgi:putative ABC transport system permease protein
MIRLAWRQFAFDPWRSALMVTAIGAGIAVVLVLEGFEQGLYAQLRQAVLRRGGDLIAAQAGVTSMTAARSVLPQLTRNAVEAVPGVGASHPLTSLPAIYEQDGRRTPVFLLVFDTVGGPRQLMAGGAIQDERGIVIDQSLARRYELSVGDGFILSEFRFRVDGITRGESALFTPFAYVTYDGLIDYYFKADLAGDIATFPLLSFLLIDVQPGADRGTVAAAIERAVPDVDVFTPVQLARNDEQVGRGFFGPIMRLLIGIAYVAGVLVVGLFMSGSVGSRTQDFGVLKALGFGSAALFATVLAEALLVTALAAPVGIGLAQALAASINAAVPVYLVLPLVPAIVARTLAACVAFAALGALVPVRAIAHIEPALVFRT